MSHADQNLFSIGEIASSIGITRRIILNYEEKGLIAPDSKDGKTGNRYYTIDTMVKIRTIRIYQNLGLSLSEIRKYLADQNDLLPIIKRFESLRDELNLMIEKLYERANNQAGQILKITVGEQTVYCRSDPAQTLREKTDAMRQVALEAVHQYGVDTTKRLYFTEYPLSDPSKITYCAAVPPESQGNGIRYLPETRALCCYHHGAYEDISQVRKKLLSYAAAHHLIPCGSCRHVYLEGAPQHQDQQQFITQIVLPIEF